MQKDLSAFFSPKSVAIIGASDTPGKVGAIILKNIIESNFKGKIFPVNPNYQTVLNLKCYKNIAEIPEIPDLTIIAIPAAANIEVLKESGEKGVKNVICIASGFKESDEAGKKLELELIDIAKKYQMNLLGPNCLGFVNNACPINATFADTVNIPGNLRLISQSGAIVASFLDSCKNINLGFSEIITLGNKAKLNENDLLEYFISHPRPFGNLEGLSKYYPIGLYLESISDGENFLKLAKKISKENPIFVLKPGKTKEAKVAMQSHTGSIAGEEDILEEALKEVGVIRCSTLEDFINLARTASFEDAPLGPKVAIISNAGGPAIIASDAIIENGLELAKFDEITKQSLTGILPSSASINNPIDVLGDGLADRFIKTCEIVLKSTSVDAVILILTPQTMTEPEKTAQGLGELLKKYSKPIYAAFIGGNRIFEAEKILHNLKIPVFRFPERAIYALGKMWEWKKYQLSSKEETGKTILTLALEKIQKTQEIDIPTPPSGFVSTLEEAENFTQNQGWPVVLKISSPDILHKKDLGGVIIDIGDSRQLEKAWNSLKENILKLDQATQEGLKIQIQKQITGGIEVIVGIKNDPTFGSVLLFGAGGTLAEVINDKNLALLPIDINKAKELVEKSKISVLLKGYRGQPPFALEKLYQAIVKLGQFKNSRADIAEIEINPLIVTQNDVFAVDIKTIFTKKETTAPLAQLQKAEVVTHQILASTYHFFNFKTETELNFEPGQYISVKVAENNFNAYSIVKNNEKNLFSLLVDIKPGGPGSKYFENLKTGEMITYLGPFGNFILNSEDGANQLLFLATGCGIAPIRSLIESALVEHRLQIPIRLYFGLSYPDDLFWGDYFQKLSLDYPNFKYKIAVWKPDNSWQGYEGFITKLLEQDILDASESAVYLCGNQQMITDAENLLIPRNLPEKRVYTEKL